MYVTREEWGARPARSGPGPLTPSRVEGIALHWPGGGKIRGVENVKAALRGWQNFHMDSKGWSDIAYQEAFDQDGNVYELRGLRTQSAANGDTDPNERFGALLLILGPGEVPTDRMLAAVRRRIARHRQLFPRSDRIVGHRDIRPEPTDCPGAVVEAAIQNGWFEPGVNDDGIRVVSHNVWVGQSRGSLRRNLARLVEDTHRPALLALQEAGKVDLDVVPPGYHRFAITDPKSTESGECVLLVRDDVTFLAAHPLRVKGEDWPGPKHDQMHNPRRWPAVTVETEDGWAVCVQCVHRVPARWPVGRNKLRRQAWIDEDATLEQWFAKRRNSVLSVGDHNSRATVVGPRSLRSLARRVGGFLRLKGIDGVIARGCRVEVKQLGELYGSDGHRPVVITARKD